MEYRPDKNKLKRLVKKHNKILDNLLKDVFKGNSMLFVVLKYHFAFEFLIDRILESSLEEPKYILDRTFSQKLKIFESLGLDYDDRKFRKIISGFNKIRNEFAHNPKFNLCSPNGLRLIKVMSVADGRGAKRRFIGQCNYLSGYLRTLWSLHSLFPVFSSPRYSIELKKDMWLKGSLAEKELNKEAEAFIKAKMVTKILISPH